MTQVKIEGAMYLDTSVSSDTYAFFAGRIGDWANYKAVVPYDIVFDLPPDFDSREFKVARLREEMQAARAAFEKTMMEYQNRLNNLLAIEHTPEMETPL